MYYYMDKVRLCLREEYHPVHAKNSGLLTQNFLQQVMENYTQLCSSIAP